MTQIMGASKLNRLRGTALKNLIIQFTDTSCLCLLFGDFGSKHCKMKIKAYLKPHCGWSMGVRAIMDKYSLEYEDLDIINNQNIYAEMVEKSGQPLSPCVELDGVMLADVSGEEVENYMLSNKLVESTNKQAGAPTNSPCPDEVHEERAKASNDGSPIRFF